MKESLKTEAFGQQMLAVLREHKRKYPAMQKQDVIKFAFQGMLGVGHLLASRESVSKYIETEMNALRADPGEPLFEALSPDWCRLSLRRAGAEKLPPDVIAGMMLSSPPFTPFTREDVREFCKTLSQAGEAADLKEDDLNAVTDEKWLPSHSPQYREKYHPSYRVVSADWIRYSEAVLRISRCVSEEERLLITIDGPCASGKTSFARRLAAVFRAVVVHTDDFVIPHAQKTAERLAIPGGNCDAERLAEEVIEPWIRGRAAEYRKYDCVSGRFLDPEALPPAGILILEGSCSNLPAIRKYAKIRIFMDAPWEVRKKRLEQRESAESLKRFYDRWIPLEEAYFSAYHLPDDECVTCLNAE